MTTASQDIVRMEKYGCSNSEIFLFRRHSVIVSPDTVVAGMSESCTDLEVLTSSWHRNQTISNYNTISDVRVYTEKRIQLSDLSFLFWKPLKRPKTNLIFSFICVRMAFCAKNVDTSKSVVNP